MRAEKTIHIQYFASLREARGRGEETVQSAARTAADLYGELRAKYRFALDNDIVRVCINDAFSPWETVLHSGDRVVFIPPVAGG